MSADIFVCDTPPPNARSQRFLASRDSNSQNKAYVMRLYRIRRKHAPTHVANSSQGIRKRVTERPAAPSAPSPCQRLAGLQPAGLCGDQRLTSDKPARNYSCRCSALSPGRTQYTVRPRFVTWLTCKCNNSQNNAFCKGFCRMRRKASPV